MRQTMDDGGPAFHEIVTEYDDDAHGSLSSLNWIKRNAWTAFGVPVGAIEQGGRG